MPAPDQMTGLWLEEGRLEIRTDLPVPRPPAGECLVRVLQAGICNTDLELVRGYYPFSGIPGHEFVGLVEEGPDSLKGKRVAGEINASCGACETCRAGRRTHCPDRTVLGIVGRNGAFARYLTLPQANLHPLPDSLDDDKAVFVEPLAAALEIQEQIPIRDTDKVLVIGDGKLGQLIARSLALTRCRLQVAGRHPEKLARLEKLGITTCPPAETGTGHDVVVECTGNASGFDAALQAVRPRGTLVMKSTYADPLSLRADQVVVNEITVIGSRCGPFAPAIRRMVEGSVDPSDLIQERCPLDRALEAFEEARSPGALKVLIRMDGKA